MVFKKIEELCRERGVSIARLEKEVGLANATVRRWATSSPSADNLKKVADYFGCTVDSLLSGNQ